MESQALPTSLSHNLKHIEPFEFMADVSISKAYAPLIKEGEEANETDGKWVVEGYASTSDLDSQDHTITKEAIEQGALSLQTYTTLLFNHDPNKPIGFIEKAEAQDGKLFIKAIISNSELMIWKKIQDGSLSKFSVFGKILDAEEGELESKQILVIKSMELYEVSVVSVPANSAAKALGWYVEKAMNFMKGTETGYNPQALVPYSWIEKRKAFPFEKEDDQDGKKDKGKSSKKNGGNPMAKNESLEQALNFLKAALDEAEDEDSRAQLDAQVRALEALQKGEGPMDNDPENAKRKGKADGGKMGLNSFPTNFPPNTKKTDVGDEADLSLASDEDTAPSFMESLESALLALQNASPAFEEEDVDIAAKVIQWIQAKMADTAPAVASPGAVTRTASASAVAGEDSFSKAITDLQNIAKNVTDSAGGNAEVLTEIQTIQKSVNDTAQAILAVANQLTNTSMRKGQGPEDEGTERDDTVVDGLSMLEKSIPGFSDMTPQDKVRLYLNRVGSVGH